LGEERPLAEAIRAAEMIRDEERFKSLVVDVENSGFLSLGLASTAGPRRWAQSTIN